MKDDAGKSLFDLESFKRANASYIKKEPLNTMTSWNFSWESYPHDYSPEQIQNIINSGSIEEKQKLSRAYFYRDGYYR